MEELEVIVQRMMDAGEPEDNIRMVIEEFNKGQEVKTSTTTPDAVVEGVEIASPAPSKSLDTSSVSQRLQDNPDDVSAVITSLKNAWNKSKMEASRLGEFWQLGDSDNETTDIASSMLANAIFGSDEIEEYIKKYGKDSFVAAGLGKEELLESIKGRKKQKQEDSLDTETLEVIESFKNGDIIKGVGAVGSAIVGALGSAAYGIGTLGAGYFMDFAADNFIEFNEGLAKRKGVSLEELILNDEANTVTPTSVAYFQALAETFGLVKTVKASGVGRNLSKYIAGKAMKSATGKAVSNLVGAGVAEGSTEIFQYGAEQYNNKLGETGNQLDAGKEFFNSMFSQQGLEQGLQGAFGGAGLASPSLINTSFKTRTPTDYNSINKDLEELNVLNKKYNLSRSKVVKEGIQQDIDRIKNNIKERVEKNNDIVNNLSPEQIREIDNLGDLAETQVQKVKELNDQLERGDIDQKQYTSALKGFNATYQDAKNRIQKIALEKDIKFAKEGAEKLGIEVQVLDTENNPEDQKIIDETFVDKKGKKVSGVEGAYSPKDNKIYIDKVEAAKKEKVTVGSHELLHGILANAAKIDNKILEDFKKELSTDQINIINKKLTDNYDANYIKNNPDEFITQFSDAIAANEISFNENLFTKLGDLITPILRAVGFSKIKFDTGRDVYNFMREYSKSMDQGQISRDILQAVDTKQQPADTKFSRSNLDNKLKQYDNDPKKLVRNMLTYPLSKSEYAKETGAINEAITKRLYDPILPDKKKLLTRDEFLDALIGESATMVEQEYDGSQSLDKFVSNRLNLRANSLAKRLGIEQEIKTEVSDAKGITVEQEAVKETTKPTKSKLRRALKIDDNLINKVKNTVRKTLGTKLPPIESPKFKLALKKAFRTELKVPLAKLLGTRENYKKFLENNFENIYNALPQETLNKRFKQFIEDTGKREKTAEGKKIFKKRSIDKKEFVDYFLGSKVGASTKGTRKDALAESLGEIMALDATMEVSQEPDIKTKREEIAKLQGQKVTPTDKAKIALTLNRDPDIKFSKKNIDKILGGKKVLDSNNKKDREFFYNTIENIFPQFLPSLVISSSNMSAYKNKRGKYQYITGNQRRKLLEQYKKNEREFSDREINIVKIAQQDLWGKFDAKRNPIKFGSKEYFDLLNDNYDGVEYILFQFQEMLKTYPETGPVIAAFFSSSSSYTGHMLRQFAMPRGEDINFRKFEKLKEKNPNKYKTEKEHVWQQNQAGEVMAWMIATGNVKKWMPFIKDNYYMLGLTAVNNDKLKDTKGVFGPVFNYGNQQAPQFIEKLNEALKENNPDLAIESIIRYFNTEVNNNNDGFNSNELTFDGKSISELYNVTVDKSLRDKETQAFQNELIREQVLGEEINAQKEVNAFLGIAPSKEKAATKNNNMLPAEIKFSKSEKYTNNNVLDKMSEIDNTNTQEELKFSKSAKLSEEFNKIIEGKTGIGKDKTYSRVKAEVVGANKGRFNWFIPPSAEDFVGLLYKTLGKGKIGDSQMAWYKAHLLNPFARAMDNISRDRVALMNDFKELKKKLKVVPKTLKKKIPGENFTQEQAIRVYIWNKQGMSIPGMAQGDIKELTDFIENNPDLVVFANQLIQLQKGDQYAQPTEGWLAGNITTDLIEGINTVKRSKYLEVWQQNVNEIFSEPNLNKLEAAYGKNYRVALENILRRMKTGKNRSFGGDTLTGRVTDWLTNSIGAIMFFNTRSAVLQTISAINFINFSDNNIFKAGKAFGNQKQFWSDFKTLFNSDFLVERRDGLRLNVNEADIADMAKKGGVRGVISELLRLGFLPTQIADSFAIASGGSTFYRNRIKALEKQGMSKKEAETQAFQDFRETAEESQQSSRPDRISQQQAGPLGRVILAFANTPAQYARLIKKAASDLRNGRGDAKSNISKIVYYGIAQNLIFNALQQALFALAFDDEEEKDEKKEKRYINIVNGMADSILRGAGISGAIFSVLKNVSLRLSQESEKKSPEYQDVLVKEIAQISPPISSKLGKLRQAGRSYSWNKKEMMEKGWSIDNPAYLAAGQVIAATTNIPLDRAFKKIDNIRNASDSDLQAWQRIASIAGWSDWELGIKDDEVSKPYVRIKRKPRSSSQKVERKKRKPRE